MGQAQFHFQDYVPSVKKLSNYQQKANERILEKYNNSKTRSQSLGGGEYLKHNKLINWTNLTVSLNALRFARINQPRKMFLLSGRYVYQ